jgi:hypothetical protein
LLEPIDYGVLERPYPDVFLRAVRNKRNWDRSGRAQENIRRPIIANKKALRPERTQAPSLKRCTTGGSKSAIKETPEMKVHDWSS